MADDIDLHTLAWRLAKLEERHAQQDSTFARQLAEQRTATDAIIAEVRTTMRNDYLTRDQTENAFLSKTDAHRGGVVRREWLLVLVSLTSIAGIILQVVHP